MKSLNADSLLYIKNNLIIIANAGLDLHLRLNKRSHKNFFYLHRVFDSRSNQLIIFFSTRKLLSRVRAKDTSFFQY